MKIFKQILLTITVSMILGSLTQCAAGQIPAIEWGLSETQGPRKTQEDRFVADTKQGLFAVLDGHGGETSSQRASELIPRLATQYASSSPAQAWQQIIDGIEAQLRQENATDGSTLIGAIIKDGIATIANLGDARAIHIRGRNIVRDANQLHATTDFKPTDKLEIDRILLAGGLVFNKRVNGTLAVSRALGDFDLKLPAIKEMYLKDVDGNITTDESMLQMADGITADWVSSQAAIYNWQLLPGDILILACDGLWDTVKNTEIPDLIGDKLTELTQDEGFNSNFDPIIDFENVEFVQGQYVQRKEDGNPTLAMIARHLRDLTIQRGSTDNVTVLVIKYNGPQASVAQGATASTAQPARLPAPLSAVALGTLGAQAAARVTQIVTGIPAPITAEQAAKFKAAATARVVDISALPQPMTVQRALPPAPAATGPKLPPPPIFGASVGSAKS